MTLGALAMPASFAPARRAIVPICAVCLLAGVVGHAAGGSAALTLPVGLPGQSAVLAIDRVSLAFIPALAIAGAASSTADPGRLAALLASSLLVLCAGDSCLLVVGIGLATLALRRPALASLVTLSLVGAMAPLLAATLLPQDQWAALRSGASSGIAWGAPLLVLVAVVMLTRASGAVPPVLAAFLLVRVLFDVSGRSTPLAWGVAVIIVGLAGAIGCGLRAIRAVRLEPILAALSALGGFLAAVGFGAALAARAADQPAIASASLAGALLLVSVLAAASPLAVTACAAVIEQAGSSRLAALGGLSSPMPATMASMALAVGTIVGLPPLAGFGPIWLVVQSMLVATRLGGIASPIVLALALAAVGLALGLGYAASLRLMVIVFGGRPRTPRGAAATEARTRALRSMAGLALPLVVVGLMPGLALHWFDPVVSALAGADMASRAGPLSIRAVAGGAAWSPLAVSVLIGAPVLAATRAARRWGTSSDEDPVWDGGAGPPPDWLPFGESRAQASAPGLARSLLGMLGLDTSADGRPTGRATRHASWRNSIAQVLRGGRRGARRSVRLDDQLTSIAPSLLVCVLVALLTAAVLGFGGRLD